MIRRVSATVVGLLALAASSPPAAAQTPVFRSGVDAVSIPVSVRRENRPVAGLKAADFDLRDNNVVQQITALSVEKLPVDLTLLLDLSSSVDGPLLEGLKAAVRDTATLLRVTDRIRLVAVSEILREVFPLQAPGEPLPLEDLRGAGATSLYDGLSAVMMQASAPGRLQLTIAFTDGRDSASVMDEAAAQEVARLSDSVVHLVVPRRPDTNHVGVLLAQTIAPTGGRVFWLRSGGSVSRIFRRMLDDFRAGYVLQYVPRGVPRAGWHEVSVRLKTSQGYDIRARKGYRGQE